MKKSELQNIIKEELKAILKESQAPNNHKVDGEFVTLIFNNPKDCQDAKQYYSKVYPVTTPDKKGLAIPITAVIRFLINNMQNKAYNPSMTIKESLPIKSFKTWIFNTEK
jgi:hypothetical protein